MREDVSVGKTAEGAGEGKHVGKKTGEERRRERKLALGKRSKENSEKGRKMGRMRTGVEEVERSEKGVYGRGSGARERRRILELGGGRKHPSGLVRVGFFEGSSHKKGRYASRRPLSSFG